MIEEGTDMRTRTSAVVSAGLALAFSVTACSSTASKTGGTSPAAQGSPIAGAGSGTGRTLTVWYMDGDLSTQAQTAIGAAFTKATGIPVKLDDNSTGRRPRHGRPADGTGPRAAHPARRVIVLPGQGLASEP